MENVVKVDITANDDVITEEISIMFEGMRKTILKQITNTREKLVRDTLIAMGWTPPGGSNPFKDQAKFMEACGQTTGVVNESQAQLYSKLVEEEFIEELCPALEASNELEVMDGVIDTLVTTIGVGLSYFTAEQLEAAWAEVWRSNMSKLDPVTGQAIRRGDGKVLKGPGYFRPDLSKILGAQ